MFATWGLALDFLVIFLSSKKSWAQTQVSAVTSSTKVEEENILVPTMEKIMTKKSKSSFYIESEPNSLYIHLLSLRAFQRTGWGKSQTKWLNFIFESGVYS